MSYYMTQRMDDQIEGSKHTFAEMSEEMSQEDIRCAAGQFERPSVLFRPKLFIEGDQWCALYGDNLQEGLAGFGESPEKAMRDFDKNWSKPLEGWNHE